MDLSPSPRAAEYAGQMTAFMADHVYPAEPVYQAQRHANIAAGKPWDLPEVVSGLKREARGRGLWNLFLPDSDDPAHGLSVVDYAQVAEISGRSPEIAPEAINCAAPDTGNMEILHMFGSAAPPSP